MTDETEQIPGEASREINPRQDVRKLVRIRAAHKGAFTKLEPKINLTLGRPIVSQDQLFEAEGLLSTLKSKSQIVHRYDAEIELLIEDENELATEIETNLLFDEKVSVAIARCEALIANYKKNMTVTPSLPNSVSSSKMRLPKLQLPSFTGLYTEWMSFIDLFRASVDGNNQLSDSEKLNYLKVCLVGDAAKLIASVTITDANYSIAMKLLHERYENKRCIVQAHLKAIWTQPSMRSESAVGLRKILETTNEHLRALAELGEPIDSWDSLLIFWIIERLDSESRKQWQLANPGTHLLKWEDLAKFLDTRSRALELGAVKEPTQNPTSAKGQSNQKPIQSYTIVSVCGDTCQENHKLSSCPLFHKMSAIDRQKYARQKQVCFNCLHPGHNVGTCTSKFSCRECKLKHHSLLHRDKPSTVSTQKFVSKKSAQSNLGTASTSDVKPNCNETQGNPIAEGFCAKATNTSNVLLSTALVKIQDHSGKNIQMRALLDSGSQASFITESNAKALMLKVIRTQTPISPLGAAKAQKTLGILPTRINQAIDTSLHIIPKITNILPVKPIDISQLKYVKTLPLADPTFNVPGKIDILLGADVLEDIFLENRIKDNGVVIRESLLGWVVSGPVKEVSNPLDYSISSNVSVISTETTDDLLSRFWELENVPIKKHLTAEEAACEQHFNDTTIQKPDGRFVVQLPFRSTDTKLGLSRASALKRFFSLERKLNANPELKRKYIEFIQEFIDLGHMEQVPKEELDNPNCYYLPHHCVHKPDSTTTKLRVVFDASARTTSGHSLNDCLLVGPKLQDDLFNILVRFRFFKIAMSADISKMYRQVELNRPDRDFHRILWRSNSMQPVQTLRMTRVTYGNAAASYHSIRALTECANQPNVSNDVQEAIRRDFYVDDILTGAPSVEQAKDLQKGLISALERNKFELRKWTCSDSSITLSLPPEYREANESFEFLDTNHTIKTLGVVWNPSHDDFSFKIQQLDQQLDDTQMTKRKVLSDIAKIFDPLGWLSPVTLKLKHIMQNIWQTNVGWDDKLPSDIFKSYTEWRSKLHALRKIKLQRFVLRSKQADIVFLHLFCDASEIGYAACIFIVAQDELGGRSSTLLTAKAKIAPLKTQSIPRLELCAALLGCQLVNSVLESLNKMNVKIQAQYAWTDSTIVLNWLSSEPSVWATFVANRVAKIQENKNLIWNHVQTHENPADPASRGVDPSKLENLTIWWVGPDWLKTHESFVPFKPEGTKEEIKKSSQNITVMIAQLPSAISRDVIDLSKHNSLQKAIRITAFVLRFIDNLRKKQNRKSMFLIAAEIKKATDVLVRQEQRKAFSEEIESLKRGSSVRTKSKILKLYPFLHNDILHVGGRCANAEMPDEAMYPQIVPQKSELARLIIHNAHLKTLHGGTIQTIAEIRTRFWIPACRNQVRKVIANCVTCCRFNSSSEKPLMGDLPKSRITVPSKAFQHVGLDFGGPFLCKSDSKDFTKAYLALFVCFASKAVHLEIVSDLTTQACIAALRRFTSRRGCPATINSDNGSNFQGSLAELLKLKKILNDSTENSIQAVSAGLLIEWNFIPPRAPHFGGLWEAGIKSAKKHLRRIMGNNILSFEELSTLFCQVENVLNSRPIGLVSDDPKDEVILTPGHLISGSKLECYPTQQSSQISDLKECSATARWTHIQNVLCHFWNRWKKEYVSTLQERTKWTKESSNLKVGDIVYVMDDNAAPLQWPLARVSYVYSGPDKFVRVVKVRTPTGEYNRPVNKLKKLPLSDVYSVN